MGQGSIQPARASPHSAGYHGNSMFHGTQRRFACALLTICLFAALSLRAQEPASGKVIGTVTAVSGNSVTVQQDSGASVEVSVSDGANIVRTAPGSKTLAGAAKITLADIAPGDRVLMLVSGVPPAAKIVVVNKKSDLAARQQQEEADWARRGVGGLVKSVDPAAGTVTIAATNRDILIRTTPSTVIRRYAPGSIRFQDAQPSTLAAIHPGDQLTARGARNGDQMTAEEIVSGSFRNIAGTVSSVDATAGTLTVEDLLTKTTVTIKTTPDSDLRRLDPQMAQMIAMRLRAGAGAGASSPAGGGPGGPRQAGGPPGAWHQNGGGQGSGGGFAHVLQHSPEIHVADLHKGDAVLIVATSGNPDSATAIRLVTGVEPMLQASASGSQSLLSSAWNGLGGGTGGGEGDQGGEGAP